MKALIMKELYLALTTTCILKHTDTFTGKADRHIPPPTRFSPSSPAISHWDKCVLANSHITYWLSLLLSTLWWHRCHNPCFSAPSHAEIVGQRAVKGVYALSLRGIKDVKGLKRIKVGAMLPRLLPASISLWAGAKFSVPNKKSKERFTLKLC